MDRPLSPAEQLRREAQKGLNEHFDTKHSHKEIIHDTDMYNVASPSGVDQNDPSYSMTAGYTGPVENIGGYAGAEYEEDEDRRGLGARSRYNRESQPAGTGLGVPGSRAYPEDENYGSLSNLISASGIPGDRQIPRAAIRQREAPRDDDYDIGDDEERYQDPYKNDFILNNLISPDDAATLESIEARREGGITPAGSFGAKAQSKANRQAYARHKAEEFESRVVVDENEEEGESDVAAPPPYLKNRSKALQKLETAVYGHQLKDGPGAKAQRHAVKGSQSANRD